MAGKQQAPEGLRMGHVIVAWRHPCQCLCWSLHSRTQLGSQTPGPVASTCTFCQCSPRCAAAAWVLGQQGFEQEPGNVDGGAPCGHA